jgi:Gelsolin repeat
VSSITPERVLLLDSFFTVVVHTGATLAAWRKAGYAEQPEHSALAALLRAPLEEAKAIVHSRCPTSRLVVCDQGGSQARFLLARLNPSTTHMTAPDVAGGGELIYTEDVSLEGAHTQNGPVSLFCGSVLITLPSDAHVCAPVRTPTAVFMQHLSKLAVAS